MTAISALGRLRSHPGLETGLRARVGNCPTTYGRLSIATRFLLSDNRYHQAGPRRQSDIKSRHACTKACLLARVVPERPTARQRGDSKCRQRTGHTLSAPRRVENSKIKPLFLGNQEPQKSLCNRDVGPVLRSLDSRFPGNDGISEHALVQPHPPQRVRVPSHNLRNPRRQAAKIIGRRRDQPSGQRPAFV